MSRHYQELDAPHFDYDLVTHPGLGEELFRGPAVADGAPYMVCIGGAQTFGRFVARPFAQTLGAAMGLPCRNLGLGGAGPRFALRDDVRRVLDRAKLVVVQYFSGRSASCSLFDNSETGRASGRYLPTSKYMRFEQFFERMAERQEPHLLQRIVEEMREDYVDAMVRLARSLQVPKVALWISQRVPDYPPGFVEQHGWMNGFPQLLDRAVVTGTAGHFDAYVECVDSAGLPQRLWQAGTAIDGAELHRDGFLYNTYYPAQEHHDHAARLLLDSCMRLSHG
jgi:hypothetical protein